MDTQESLRFFFFFLLSLLFLSSVNNNNIGVHGSCHHHHHHHHHHHKPKHLLNLRPSKLFVFGDSYVDTGNIRTSLSNSWKPPYGITFPGKPSGRFSNGRVLTDFLARFIGVKSPMPYKWRNIGAKHLKYGMNFAYGGTGVFDTFYPFPNMTTQIDLFRELINEKVYTTKDIASSAAIVSVAGNDYSTYITKNGSAEGLTSFIGQVVNQLTLNLKRVHSLGVKKIAVNALQPLGCLPGRTIQSSFKQCNESENALVNFHNIMLQQAVDDLNNETKFSTFVVVDLYTSFTTVIMNSTEHRESSPFENPLKPCCLGISSGDSCGDVDENGAKKYTVCEDPDATFFWDNAHPTQAGWQAVYSALQSNLEQLYYLGH